MLTNRLRSRLVLCLMACATASFAQTSTVTHYMVTGVVSPTQDDFQLFSSMNGTKFTARLDIDRAAIPAATFTQDGSASWYSWVLSSPGPQQGFSVTLANGVTLSTLNAANDPIFFFHLN